jgi:hypothetical protein
MATHTTGCDYSHLGTDYTEKRAIVIEGLV